MAISTPLHDMRRPSRYNTSIFKMLQAHDTYLISLRELGMNIFSACECI